MNNVQRAATGGNSEDAAATIRGLVRNARTAVLATVRGEERHPYASLVAIAPDGRGEPLLLLSALAWHTQNLLHDPRASLLIADPAASEDPLAAPRVSLIGAIAKTTHDDAAGWYLAVHPEAKGYAGFNDFAFHRFMIDTAHLVAGFGRIETLGRALLLGP
jgi:putative heme iron utilization protein